MSRYDAAAELAAAQKAVRLARQAFGPTDSAFVKAMREVMGEYLNARAQGVQREDAIKGIEEVLRSVWPKEATRYPPACTRCDDVGLEELVCRIGRRCLRPKCQTRGEDWEHRYVDPCPCDAGDKFRPRRITEEHPLAAAGKVGKPRKRGWSRIGET